MPSVDLRRLTSQKPEEIVRLINTIVDRDLGNRGGRLNLVSDAGDHKEIRGGSVPLTTLNHTVRVRSTATGGMHQAWLLSATAKDAPATFVNSVAKVEDVGLGIGAGKSLRLYHTDGTTFGAMQSDAAGTIGVTGAFTVGGAFQVNGNTTLGDAATDTVLVKGPTIFENLLTVRNGAAGAVALIVDPITPLVTIDANILLGPTAARRITGDFTNATPASRPMFQSSTVNGVSLVGILPNGTAALAGLEVYAASNPAASVLGQFLARPTAVQIVSAHVGAAFVPLELHTNGSVAVTIGITQGMKVVGNFACNTKVPAAPPVLPANAADLATAITLVNAIKAAAIAIGLTT